MTSFAIPEWLTGAVVYWVYSAAIQSLPDPDETSSKLYRFTFQFLHALAANINLVKKTSERAAIQEEAKTVLVHQP